MSFVLRLCCKNLKILVRHTSHTGVTGKVSRPKNTWKKQAKKKKRIQIKKSYKS